MSKGVEFEFRVWVHPADEDPPEIEVWYPGLEETDGKKGLVSDWVRAAMANEDFAAEFGLDPTKHWQVVGKGRLCGSHSYYGEYDEDLSILEFTKAEVPEPYFDHPELGD